MTDLHALANRLLAGPCREQDAISPAMADELLEVLSEAAVEISNFYGSGNVVAGRLLAVRERVESARDQ